MATSTSTLLSITNEVLLNVGERVVNSFDTPTARKGKQYVIEALKEFQIRDDWEFLRDVVTAISWTSPGIATLAEYQRLHAVQFTLPIVSPGSVDKVFVSYLDRPSFSRIKPTPLTATSQYAYVPLNYTLLDDNRVQLNPYPDDITTRASVSFHITKAFVLPSLTTDFLPIPERLTPLIVRLASSLMAARHLDDAESATLFRNEFEGTLRAVRAREQLTPSSGTNMFRRRVVR